MYLITSFAVFSVTFCFIAAAHDTCSDFEIDGSNTSHIRNYLSKYLNPSSWHNQDSGYLGYINMKGVVVEDIKPLLYCITWEPLLPPISELNLAYY